MEFRLVLFRSYLFRFIDALAGAATRLGLPKDQAARLALATVRGDSTLVAHADVAPGVLADRVASPGGMTREGMNVLDKDDRLMELMTHSLRAARDRGEEMAREAGTCCFSACTKRSEENTSELKSLLRIAS